MDLVGSGETVEKWGTVGSFLTYMVIINTTPQSYTIHHLDF